MTPAIPSPKSYMDRNSGVAGLRIFHGVTGWVVVGFMHSQDVSLCRMDAKLLRVTGFAESF